MAQPRVLGNEGQPDKVSTTNDAHDPIIVGEKGGSGNAVGVIVRKGREYQTVKQLTGRV